MHWRQILIQSRSKLSKGAVRTLILWRSFIGWAVKSSEKKTIKRSCHHHVTQTCCQHPIFMFFIPSQIIHNSYLWNEYKTKSPKQINHICRTKKLSSKTNINMMTKCCLFDAFFVGTCLRIFIYLQIQEMSVLICSLF